jgi:DNA adenine methylase
MTKPVLKWVGGKTQILEKTMDLFPKEMNNYHEIFLGGGSVLFALLENEDIKINGKAYAYDINEPLICMYKNIQSDYLKLYEEIQFLTSEFETCENLEVNRKPQTIQEAKTNKESYYYFIRSKYNTLNDKTSIKGSALFIFLNKTCFRGIFRLGPNGFNVPYGHYKNPSVASKEHLHSVSCLIKNVTFKCLDFSNSLRNVEKGDFVYLDPPYAPETKKSFVGYTAAGFGLEKHTLLFKMIHELPSQFMMSNSDVPLVKQNFTKEKYNTISIVCKRSINSKKPESKANEVIIINY